MSPVESALQEISTFALFRNYSQDQLRLLCGGAAISICSHRQVLFTVGQPADFFGIILSGAFKLSKPSLEGQDVIVHFATAGDILAALIMAQPHPVYPITATALGPSRFLKVPRENFKLHWKKDADLIFKIQGLLSRRILSLHDEKALMTASLKQRLAACLLALLEKQTGSKSLELPLPLTRKEIAEYLGVTVESVIRIMSDWSKQGLIATNDQQISLLRPEMMIELLKVP